MNYACAAGIGAVSGLRSMSAPAIVAQAANRNQVRVRKTPLAWLAWDDTARTAAVLAAGEMIADKLPFMPDRTAPLSLMFRALSGAVCGYGICGAGRTKRELWIAAAVGASAAVAASYAGSQYRKRVKLPSMVAALLEDAVTIAAGKAVIASIGR